jgi:hypothetical protein
MMAKTKTSYVRLLALAIILATSTTEGFFASKPGGAKAKSSPQADKAVEIFDKNYSFNRPPVKSSPLSRFGMPVKDFDGTVLQKRAEGTAGKRLTDIDEKQARTTFNELAKLYGDEEALKMVKDFPICLVFNKNKFGHSLDALIRNFGEEKAKGMVQRNPGLLAITPEDAAGANEQTMVFSYLIGITRPASPILLPALFFALFSPAIEAVTGIPVRTAFLAAISGQ